MSQFFNQKGKITPMKKFFQRVWAIIFMALVFGTVAAVLGFLVGFSYKVYLITYHLWI